MLLECVFEERRGGGERGEGEVSERERERRSEEEGCIREKRVVRYMCETKRKQTKNRS